MSSSAQLVLRHKPSKHRLISLLAVALTAIPACGGSGPTPPAGTEPPTTAQLIEWALGSDQRGSYPPTPDAYLTLLSEQPPEQSAQPPKSEASPASNSPQSGTRITPQCADIHSILPGPLGELFMLLGGALHVLLPKSTGPVPVSGDASVRFTQLMGFHAEGSSTQILAAAQAEGSGELRVWSLTISGRESATFHAEPLADERKPRTVEEFFATYQSPRCHAGGKQCLVLGNDLQQDFIQIAPKRGAPQKTLRPLGKAGVRDVAWKPGGGIYAVMSCPANGSP
jgi:hypothetical protein